MLGNNLGNNPLTGELELEDRFYFYATQSQQFIKAFCQKSKKESFIRG